MNPDQIAKFTTISINGRFIYGYLCLVNATNYTASTPLPNELNKLFYEFPANDLLDEWHSKVEEILPSFILEVNENASVRLPEETVQKIKAYYQELPPFIVSIIDNLFWLGICNLYVAFNPQESLDYLSLIIQTMNDNGVTLPDFEKIAGCSIDDEQGWGKKDNLDHYLA